MMSKKSLWRAIVAACIGIVIAVAAARWPILAQQRAPDRPFEPTPFQEGACLAFGAAETARNAATGAMRFIGTPAGFPLTHPLGHDARTAPETAARGFLTACGSLFGLTGEASELSLESARTTDDKRSIVRFQQMSGGVPVFGGEIIVHLDPNRSVIATTSKILPRPRVAAAAQVTALGASRAAIDAIAKVHAVPARDLSAAAPQLWVYDQSLIGPGRPGARLVWRTEVTAGPLEPIRELVLIDATRGSVALHFNQTETALQRQTYTANNNNSLPGTLVCNESNPTCAGGDAHAVGAHLGAADTYNFYVTHHGRDGIDGFGSIIQSTVHYSQSPPQPYANAFWNGAQMVYGDAFGFPLADDVVAHELTHGVTQFTSNLFYYYQSGAINESLSDVFGEFVDQTNGRGNDAPGVKWLVGEDVTGSGAIRSMSDPPSFGDPDRMTSPNYYLFDGDNGGVHTNSGINNKAAYLMVEGGTFNGQTIAPLGIDKVAKIYYEAQTHLLTSAADYNDLYNALFQACNNIAGTNDIYTDDCLEVRKATLAVEMNLQPVSNFNVDAPFCPAGQTPAYHFYDDLESGIGAANFVTMPLVGTDRWTLGSPYGPFAHSGRFFLYGDDYPAVVTDSAIAMRNFSVVGLNYYLHFAHAFGFEDPNYDGGVVEYSTDDGVTWVDAGPLFDNVGYNGTIASGFGNPLTGRAAFVGDSHGYVASRLNLSSLAGQSVRFRWRMGLDSSVFDWGWWLDDVIIYSCTSPPAPFTPTSPNPADGSTAVATNTTLTWNAGGATTFDMAFGTVNPPPPVATGVTGFKYAAPLAPGTTYYWRVTARNAGGATMGPIWSFTTAAPPSDLLVLDHFTGSGPLSDHLPDVNVGGVAWNVTGGTPEPTLSGGVVGVTAGSGHVQATIQTGAPDVRVSADYRVGAGAQRLAALAFRLTDANNHLLLMFYQNALHFYRRQAGTYTLLASSAPLAPFANGSTQRMEVRTSGSQLTGWWNGVQVVQATDTVQRNATRHGLDWNSAFDPTATFDNLEIRNNGAPLVPPSTPTTPSPANAATGVALGTTLTWSAPGATTYDIRFDTMNPPGLATEGSATATFAPALSPSTTYYWQITARNGAGSAVGPVWSFTTAALPADLLFIDTFTDTDTTLLPAHIPDFSMAGSWTVTGGTPTPTLSSGTVGVTAGSGHLQATVQTGAPDIRMGVDYRVGAGGNQLAALVFRLTDANNHLLLMYFQNALHFYRRQAGAYTLLASSAALAPVASGSTQRLEVRTSGTQLTGWWNGVQVVSTTDSVQQAATRHGVDWNSAFDPTARFDNVEIRNNGAPLLPPTAPGSPSPANNATSVAPNSSLTWTASGATSYDIAFGTTNPPAPAATGLGSATYTPTMTANTTYYWQVIARNAFGSATGPIWTFTTGSPPVDLLVSDTFTGSTVLTSHTPDVNVGGAPWIVTGDPSFPLLSDGSVGILPGNGHVQATLQTGAPDIRMGVDYRVGAFSSQLAALAFRLTDANNHLLLMFYSNALHFYRKQGGSYTLLASSGPLTPVASGSTQRLEVRTSGSQLTGWWNGVQVVQAIDVVQQSATRHGLDWNSAFDPFARFDNLEIRNAGAPLVPPNVPTSPSPADAATGVAITASLTWTASGATSHDIAFGTVNPPPPAATGLSTGSYTPPTMAASTTYYWRVTARNASGSTAGPVWSFTTGALPVDLLVSDTFTGPPGVSLTTHAPEINLGGQPWSVTGGTANLQAGEAVVATSGSGHVQATLQTGAPDVRVSADYRVGLLSQQLAALAFRFTDANNHLLLMFYQNALHFYRRQGGVYTLLGSSPPLAPIAGGSTQRIEVRALGTQLTGWWNGVQVVQATDAVQQTATRHGLDWNVSYDPAAMFDNFEIRNIGAPLVPPSAPFSPSPSDNATGVSTNSPLTWSALGATSHDIAFGTVNPPPPAATGLSAATYAPALAANTTYFWQVTARNGSGTTVGPVWTFVTGAGSPPATPAAPTPASGASGVATNTSLLWSAPGATSYNVAFGTVNPPPPAVPGLTSASYTPPALGGSTTYFWQITAVNANGSTTGPVWSFTTAPAPPAVPNSPDPADGSTGFSGAGFIRWSAAGATSYDVAFGRVSPPSTIFPGLTSAQLSPVMYPNTRYFWRVTARNAQGSTTGPIWSFTTSGPTEQLLASDTFTGANGTQLFNHLLDFNPIGSSWSITGSPPIPTLNNGSVGVTAGTKHTQATLLIGLTDVRMAADYRVGAGPNQLAGLALRFIDENNHILLMFYQNTLQFYRRTAGNYTLLATSAPLAPIAAGSTQRLEVRTAGSQLTGLWNGVPVVEASDPPPANPAALRYGLDWNPSYDPTASFDNFELYNLGAASSPPSTPSGPIPLNGALNVSVNTPLQWAPTPGALVYDVAFGTSAPLPIVVSGYVPGTPTPSVTVTMSANTTYTWQVIARNAGGATIGPAWVFTTATGSPGCLDTDSDRLCDSFETNTGVYVSPTNTGTSPTLPDTDGDGIRDGDEVLGTLGGLNLPAMGLSPLKKNILLEYDWIDDADECVAHSHRPTQTMLNRVAAAFAGAPVLNPDGTSGIALIQDFGQGGVFNGGNVFAHAANITGGLGTDFYAVKTANFAANRSGYFHYVVMPHWYTSNTGSSGLAEIAGDDLIVSLGCFITTENVANTIMHELGHNLGLLHGGNESCNWKPNYNSVMNYRFQFPGVDTSCNALGSNPFATEGNVLDYSRGTRISLNELNLNESVGTCGGAAIDWNFNGAFEAFLSYDLNRTSSSPNASTPTDNNACVAALSTLTDSNDWANITFVGINDSDGAVLPRPVVDCNNPAMPRVIPPELRRN